MAVEIEQGRVERIKVSCKVCHKDHLTVRRGIDSAFVRIQDSSSGRINLAHLELTPEDLIAIGEAMARMGREILENG